MVPVGPTKRPASRCSVAISPAPRPRRWCHCPSTVVCSALVLFLAPLRAIVRVRLLLPPLPERWLQCPALASADRVPVSGPPSQGAFIPR